MSAPETPEITDAPEITETPVAASPVGPPSVHLRALATWLTIFPLVAIGMTVMGPFTGEWHPVLRALLLTAIVVPLAVYFVVPRVIKLLVSLTRKFTRS